MKFLFIVTAIPLGAWAEGNNIAFENRRFFGVSRGGKRFQDPGISDEDFERAQKAIADAVVALEKKIQHTVEEEVDTLFHDLEHHEKESIKEKAKASIQKGVSKVRKSAAEENETKLPFADKTYPFDWPKGDAEHRILHAVESVEKAVVHAVGEEVETLFHGLERHDRESTEKVGKVLQQSVAKTSKKVEKGQEDRRNFFKETVEGKRKPIEEILLLWDASIE